MSGIYTDGEYEAHNPTWHAEDSAWKVRNICLMLERNGVHPGSVAEVGCGAGLNLALLQEHLGADCTFQGFDVSPQAIARCAERANERLSFACRDIVDEEVSYDLLMLIDVFEHVEDYRGFLRAMRPKADHKVFHIPLDLSVQTVLRGKPIEKAHASVGHIHYFTKETALRTLIDTGYEVVDCTYTATAIDLPGKSALSACFRLPRKVAFAVHQDWAARLLGGFSLLVLAK